MIASLTTTVTSFGFGGGSPWGNRNIESLFDTTSTTSTGTSSGGAADWIIEGLVDDEEKEETTTKKIIQRPSSKNGTIEALPVGENDYLPHEGLYIGNQFHIIPSSSSSKSLSDKIQIQLLSRPNGWGSGVHPTTRLCLEFLEQVLSKDDDNSDTVVLDYGCGSGILSIASLKLGASHVIGVDIDAEALVTTHLNLQLNGYSGTKTTTTSEDDEDNNDDSEEEEEDSNSSSSSSYKLLHTRQIQPFDLTYDSSHGTPDICVANILIGQLVRPSMVAALVSNISSRGIICFSGIRPHEVTSLKSAYEDHLDWLDDKYYDELNASETEFSNESYGFDVGTWSRVVGQLKPNHKMDIRQMSELAIQ